MLKFALVLTANGVTVLFKQNNIYAPINYIRPKPRRQDAAARAEDPLKLATHKVMGCSSLLKGRIIKGNLDDALLSHLVGPVLKVWLSAIRIKERLDRTFVKARKLKLSQR